ncbi:MAG TPA: hypothetical protein VGS58_04855 [Candidatus Sulfopaludibacter sp.]|nr:hypothetical protein [Candidatus Sulfopaludibacter sp.]
MFRFPACLAVFAALSLYAAEQDALSIDQNIQARHLPYGTVLNPILTADHSGIAGYTRCGDSAIWTGHYLAAEAFRYASTHSSDALANLRGALAGLTLLTDVTGSDLLARCAVPADSPYASGISQEESANGVYPATVNGKPWIWIGNTSRDQYSGALFGLATAYDLVHDPSLESAISALATRLIAALVDHAWNVVMPNGSISTTFLIRPDQQLAFLQIGQHVNAPKFASVYSQMAVLAVTVPLPLGIDASGNQSSYFKFNLDFINLYSLIRLESSDSRRAFYEAGFAAVRAATANHLNAHFNMIDRALHGAGAARDAETRADLDAWLERPRTDVFVDWAGTIPSCGNPNEACHPLPVAERPPSDFLWQLDPYRLSGGGSGIIETAGIDYILPYWMARYYGVVPPPAGRDHFHAPAGSQRAR